MQEQQHKSATNDHTSSPKSPMSTTSNSAATTTPTLSVQTRRNFDSTTAASRSSSPQTAAVSPLRTSAYYEMFPNSSTVSPASPSSAAPKPRGGSKKFSKPLHVATSPNSEIVATQKKILTREPLLQNSNLLCAAKQNETKSTAVVKEEEMKPQSKASASESKPAAASSEAKPVSIMLPETKPPAAPVSATTTSHEVKTQDAGKKKPEKPETTECYFEFNRRIIPLSNLLANANEAFMNQLKAAQKGPREKEADIIEALITTLEVLRVFWAASPNHENYSVGLNKDTKSFGNTSVSMGVAATHFKENHPDSTLEVLNAGTGGIKCQIYKMQKNPQGDLVVALVYESKKEDETKSGIHPNSFSLEEWLLKPDREVQEFNDKLEAHLAQLHTKWGISPMHSKVLITGNLRKDWEDCKDEEKKTKLEAKMNILFNSRTGVFSSTGKKQKLFIAQSTEAYFEFDGCSEMYNNLRIAKMIDYNYSVDACFGIGQGSVQITIGTQQILVPVGMKNWKVMREQVVSQFKKELRRAESVSSDASDDVFALKSGCLLYLERYPDVLEQLLHRPPHILFEKITPPTSMPQLSSDIY